MAPWFFQSSFFLAWSNQEWMLSNIQFAANVSKSKASRKKAYIWLLCVLVQLYLSASNFLSLHTTVSCFLPPGISQHADNLFIEEDGSCWINWDKSQLRPQQVFDNTTRNYKDLQENCWERLMVRKMQNESDLFDSRNPRFQNKSSLSSFWLHIRYDHYNNHELLKVQASSERRRPRRPGFPNSVFSSWDSCLLPQIFAHQNSGRRGHGRPEEPWSETFERKVQLIFTIHRVIFKGVIRYVILHRYPKPRLVSLIADWWQQIETEFSSLLMETCSKEVIPFLYFWIHFYFAGLLFYL